jgi:hypothetical protein
VSTLVTNIIQLGITGNSGNISYDATNTEIDFSQSGNFSGNVTAQNVTAQNVTANSNVTAQFFIGDGSQLTNISGGGGGSDLQITNDTTTDGNTFFPVLSPNITSGSLVTANTSSTKLFFNPSTGTLNATNIVANANASLLTTGTISNDRTTANSANGASTIVVRDAGGNFTANKITSNGGIDVTNTLNLFSNFSEKKQTVSVSSNTVTLNLSTGSLFEFNLVENILNFNVQNYSNTSNQVSSFTLLVNSDGNLRTISWPANFKWANGVLPNIPQSNTSVFVFFTPNNGTTWNSYIAGYEQ